MSKKLLREYFELCPEGRCPVDVLTESEKRKVMNEGAVYLVGVCQRAGVKNGNGRIYNKETLSREIQKYQNAINDRRSLGELDHPDDSRGLGSVKQVNGDTIVEDDFQLICFDVVSEPSTPGAYLDPHKSAKTINISPTINKYINEGKQNKLDDLFSSILGD